MKKVISILTAVILIISAMPAFASNASFNVSDVIVSNENVVISGVATPNANIHVTGVTDKNITADQSGKFVYKATPSTGVYDITFSSGSDEEVITIDMNILSDDAEVTFNKDSSMVYLMGKFGVDEVSNVTIFALKNCTDREFENSSMSHIGDFKTSKSGYYSYEYQSPSPDNYEMAVLTCNGVQKEYIIDTDASVSYLPTNSSKFKQLPTEFAPYDGGKTDFTKNNFENVRTEFPEEMPVANPVELSAQNALYVDKNAGVANPDGSLEKPYSNLATAISKIDKDADTIIYLRKGTYYIDKTINISGITGKLIIAAYEGEEVKISTGEEISGSDFILESSSNRRINDSALGNVYSYDLTNICDTLDLTAYYQPSFIDGDNIYQYSRWPKASTTKMAPYAEADTSIIEHDRKVIDAGPYYLASGTADITADRLKGRYPDRCDGTGFEFVIDDLKPFSWEKASDMFMYGSFFAEYSKSIAEIGEFNPERQSVRTINTRDIQTSGARYEENNTFYYFNILEELTEPGEYCIDTDNMKLYVYPIGDINGKDFLLSLKPQGVSNLITIENSKNVIVSGIKFSDTSCVPINVKNSENVLVQKSEFSNIKGNAISFSGCDYSGVIYSDFRDVSSYPVVTTDIDAVYELTPNYNYIQNNKIYASGALRIGGVGVIVSHNMFSNGLATAINTYNSRECFVEYNEFIATPTMQEDMGAVYFQGFHQTVGLSVRYNYFNNCNIKSSSTVYPDELVSYNYIYGNILEGNARVHIHDGSENVVFNNLFIGNGSITCPNNHIRYFGTSWRKAMNSKSSWFGYLYGKEENDSDSFFNRSNADKYESRYPHYMEFSRLMKKRADEYRENQNDSSTYTVKYSTGETVNLDTYLRSPRDNYIANNAFVGPTKYQTPVIYEEGRNVSNPLYPIVVENNVTIGNNPFTAQNYADYSAYEKIRESINGFETLPYEKMGIMQECNDYAIAIIKPAVGKYYIGEEIPVIIKSGFMIGECVVQIATDSEFTNVVEYTSYTGSISVKDLTAGDYYIRVLGNALSKSSDKETYTSEVVKITVSNDTEQNWMKSYVTDCVYNSEEGYVEFTYYQPKLITGNRVYIASYDDDGRFESLKIADLSKFDGLARLKANVTSKNVKIFDFDENALIPYSKKAEYTFTK